MCCAKAACLHMLLQSVTTAEDVNVTCEDGAGGSLYVGVEEKGRTHVWAAGILHCPSWALDWSRE